MDSSAASGMWKRKRSLFFNFRLAVVLAVVVTRQLVDSKKLQRSVDATASKKDTAAAAAAADNYNNNLLTMSNSVEFIWSSTTVAVGDTAVLHCSFDAIFQQLRTGNIDWYRENSVLGTAAVSPPGDWAGTIAVRPPRSVQAGPDGSTAGDATPIVTGRRVVVADGRYRVYRPHNSALSVLIVRRAKKRDAGIYRCNLAGSSTRHKYMVLNVTESKIEAQTSAATQRAKVGTDLTLWCNATGYPIPVVYWTREDRSRRLPDGSYQYWGNGLQLKGVSEADTGIYSCYLDNFVQPIVSYKFSLMVEDNPWSLDGYKMRFDSKQWFPQDSAEPKPVKTKSFLLMCETREASKPLPVIRWYRDGRAVRNSRHFYIIEDSSDFRSNYASSTLVIMTFRSRFKGNYTCVASNVFRMKKLTFYVQAPADTDNGFVVRQSDSTTLSSSSSPHHTATAVTTTSMTKLIAAAEAERAGSGRTRPSESNRIPPQYVLLPAPDFGTHSAAASFSWTDDRSPAVVLSEQK